MTTTAPANDTTPAIDLRSLVAGQRIFVNGRPFTVTHPFGDAMVQLTGPRGGWRAIVESVVHRDLTLVGPLSVRSVPVETLAVAS